MGTSWRFSNGMVQGNYANNKTCAISCTGSGEFFIRGVVAYDVACLMEHKGMSLKASIRKK